MPLGVITQQTPFDYTTAIAQQQRRQAIAQALAQQAMSPANITHGGWSGLATAMSKLGEAYIARQAQDQSFAGSGAIAQQLQAQTKAGISALQQGLASQDPNVRLDAIGTAIASGNPYVRQVATDYQKHIIDTSIGQTDALKSDGISNTSKAALVNAGLGNGTGVIAPPPAAPAVKPVDVNGQVFNADQVGPNGQLPSVANNQDTWTQGSFKTADGQEIPMQQNSRTGEVKPLIGASLDLSQAQQSSNAFAKGLTDQALEQWTEATKGAAQARSVLPALSDAWTQLNSGVYSGPGANTQLLFAKLGQALGVSGSNDPAIANTEGYRAAVAREVGTQAKTLGSRLSNMDLQFLENQTGSSPDLSPTAMRRMVGFATAAQLNQLGNQESKYNQLMGIPGIANNPTLTNLMTATKIPFTQQLPPDLGTAVVQDPDTGQFKYNYNSEKAIPHGTAQTPPAANPPGAQAGQPSAQPNIVGTFQFDPTSGQLVPVQAGQ